MMSTFPGCVTIRALMDPSDLVDISAGPHVVVLEMGTAYKLKGTNERMFRARMLPKVALFDDVKMVCGVADLVPRHGSGGSTNTAACGADGAAKPFSVEAITIRGPCRVLCSCFNDSGLLSIGERVGFDKAAPSLLLSTAANPRAPLESFGIVMNMDQRTSGSGACVDVLM